MWRFLRPRTSALGPPQPLISFPGIATPHPVYGLCGFQLFDAFCDASIEEKDLLRRMLADCLLITRLSVIFLWLELVKTRKLEPVSASFRVWLRATLAYDLLHIRDQTTCRCLADQIGCRGIPGLRLLSADAKGGCRVYSMLVPPNRS